MMYPVLWPGRLGNQTRLLPSSSNIHLALRRMAQTFCIVCHTFLENGTIKLKSAVQFCGVIILQMAFSLFIRQDGPFAVFGQRRKRRGRKMRRHMAGLGLADRARSTDFSANLKGFSCGATDIFTIFNWGFFFFSSAVCRIWWIAAGDRFCNWNRGLIEWPDAVGLYLSRASSFGYYMLYLGSNVLIITTGISSSWDSSGFGALLRFDP